jgi:FG-GAP-like repeat
MDFINQLKTMKKRLVLGFWLLLGCAAGAWAQPLTVTGPVLPALTQGAVAWADYDGDGDDDAVVCGLDASGVPQSVMMHSNAGTMLPDPAQALVGVSHGDAAWGDMDADGDPDLLLTGQDANGDRVTQIYRNNAGQLVALPTPGLPGMTQSRAQWADLDGDGDLDIFIAGHGQVLKLTGIIARNDGGGVFTAVQGPSYDTRDWPAIALGDYDGDGRVDIAFTDISPSLGEGMRAVVLRNLGWLQFEPLAVGGDLRGLYGGSLDFADYNGDGKLDLLQAGMDNAPRVTIYKHVGGQLLAAAGAPMLPQASLGEAHWADIDADGDLDVVVAGMDGGGVPGTWLLLNQAGVWTAQQGPAGMPALYNVRLAFGDWDGDGFLDVAMTGQDAQDVPAAYVGTWVNGLQTFKF